MSREILVVSSAGQPQTITNFEGTTFRELKAHPVFASVYTTNQDVILNPGEYTVTSDDTVLPAGDLEVYLVPTKNKAGVSGSAINALGQKIAQALVKANEKSQTQDLQELENAIVSEIEDFFEVDITEDLVSDQKRKEVSEKYKKYASRKA